MASKKARGIAIVLGSRFTPAESLAMVIATTAATYAYDNYDEFDNWLQKYYDRNPGDDRQEISKELLMSAIKMMIATMPENL